MGNPNCLRVSKLEEKLCGKFELSQLYSRNANDITKQVWLETEEAIKRHEIKREFRIPVQKKKRKSFGLDRDMIPEARIGWMVHFYRKKELIATGKVRQFVARGIDRTELVVVRLQEILNLKPLIKENNDKKTLKLRVNLEASPSLLERRKCIFYICRFLTELRLSQLAKDLLFGDADRGLRKVVWLLRSEANDKLKNTELRLPNKLSFELNHEQDNCLRNAISKQATIIDGVVGSGKTHLAACIAFCLATERNQKILVCSAYGATISRISRLLSKNLTFDDDDDQLFVIQITKENPSHNKHQVGNKFLTQDSKRSQSMKQQQSGRLADLVEAYLRDRFRRKIATSRRWIPGDCEEEIDMKIDELVEKCYKLSCEFTRREAERKFLTDADIVCCTLNETNSPMIDEQQFDVLIVDDAHLAHDNELMKPILFAGLKQIILLGENNCFGDTLGENFRQTSLGQLFREILNHSGLSQKLTQLYRGHEKLIDFFNKQYYNGMLRSQANGNLHPELSLAVCRYLDWMPQVDSMTTIFATSHHKLIRPIIEKIIDKLIDIEKVPQSAIIIITTDKYHILDQQSSQGVRIRSVPEAVGVESDFVILSCDQWSERCQRFSWELDPNFMYNERAFQIAITRARLGIFVVAEQSLINSVLNNSPGDIYSSLGSISLIDQSSSTSDDFCGGWRNFVKQQDEMRTIFSSHTLL